MSVDTVFKNSRIMTQFGTVGHEWDYVSDKLMCKAWGDPHYKTFDGEVIDYMGTNTYIMAQRRAACTTLQDFKLIVDQEMRNGDATLGYVNWIMLIIIYSPTVNTIVKVEEFAITVAVSTSHPSVIFSWGFHFSGNIR